MPHANSEAGPSCSSSAGPEDLSVTGDDEVKVFRDEGPVDVEGDSEEADVQLKEDKDELKNAAEGDRSTGTHIPTVKSDADRPEPVPFFGKAFEGFPHPLNMGYIVAPYPYPNGMATKLGLPTGPGSPFFPSPYGPSPGGDHPPPAHLGLPPYHPLDPKSSLGLPRSPMPYPFGGPHQYPPHLLPDFSHMPWQGNTVQTHHVPSDSSASPAYMQASSPSSPHQRLASLHAHGGPFPGPDARHNHSQSRSNQKSRHPSSSKPSTSQSGHSSSGNESTPEKMKNKPHIKKPLNAFMIYMKEMRSQVVAECTLKESAAINQILGRKWHSLSREEQAKYYDMARKQRELHMQMYPNWSAKESYAAKQVAKQKKKKKEARPHYLHPHHAPMAHHVPQQPPEPMMISHQTPASASQMIGNNMKKCRARFGLDQQAQWCKPCRRKKKCIRYLSGGNSGGSGERDSGAGSLDNPNSIEDPLSVSSYGAGSDDASPSTTSSDTTANFLSSPLMMPSPLTSPPSNVPFSPMNISSPYSSVPSPALPPLNRNPVGTNPHDINNPLSVNQLTGQCNPLKPPAGLVKPEPSPIAALSAMTKPANVVSVNT